MPGIFRGQIELGDFGNLPDNPNSVCPENLCTISEEKSDSSIRYKIRVCILIVGRGNFAEI